MRARDAAVLLFLLGFATQALSGCKQIADEQIRQAREQVDQTTYGYYELYLPNPNEDNTREEYKDVEIETQYPIDWIEIDFTVSNPGDYEANVELSVEVLDFPDLKREVIKSKKVPPYSDASTTVTDKDSKNLAYLIGDCSESCDGSSYTSYVIRTWFEAINGPPDLKVKFKIVVDEANP